MPQSLVNFDNALKELYAPGLRNAINNSSAIWSEAIKNTKDIIGEEAVWSVRSGRSSSTGSRAELASLPTADRQRFVKARRGLSSVYHTIKVSGQAKHLTRTDASAFARALDTEVKGAEKDLKNDMNRQVFGQAVTVNGSLSTGVLGTLSADPGVAAVWTFANEDESTLRHFFAGMTFRAYDPATGTARTGTYEVLSVNRTAKTVTTTANADASVASGDYIARADASGTSLGNEIDGLRFLIGTANYAGITAASNPVWNSVTVGSTSTPISEVILDEAAEAVETDGSGDDMSDALFIAEHSQRRKLNSVLQAQKRYEGRETTLKSGWKGLQLAKGTLVVDRYCPTSYFFGIHRPELQKFIGLDFQWDEDDGQVFYKALDGSDAVEARFKGYVQLAATVRNCHVVGRLAAPTF